MPSLNICVTATAKYVSKSDSDTENEQELTIETTLVTHPPTQTVRPEPNFEHRPLLYIDLDARFDDDASEMPFVTLSYGENGFIALECEIVDGWIVFEDQKVFLIDEIKDHARSTESNYYSMYVSFDEDSGIDKSDDDNDRAYYRKDPIIINGIDLGSGWYCFQL